MVGGKQYKVTKGDVITTETLQVEVGDHVVLDKVLLVGTKDFTAIGTPLLAKAKVAATIEEQTRLAKVPLLSLFHFLLSLPSLPSFILFFLYLYIFIYFYFFVWDIH